LRTRSRADFRKTASSNMSLAKNAW
jgi:hypothetical protein